MKRYVLKINGGLVRWIQWTAGVEPTLQTADYEEAMIISKKYLDYKLERVGKTRRDLLKEYHPNIEIVKIKVQLIEE